MSKVGKIINNPIFNDFVYTVLFQASLEEKRGLPGRFRRIALNGRMAKKFATTASREEKEFVLSHFGMEFFYVIARKGMPLQKFKDILDKFEKNKKVAALKEISEEMVFVSSDKEFIRLLGLMSQSIHHHTYFMNMEFQRQGYHIQKWAKNNLNREDLVTREVDASAKTVVKTCLNACLTMDYTHGRTGMSEPQMKILLYLYTVSHTYVPDEKIHNVFAGNMTVNVYRTAMRTLTENFLVTKQGYGKEISFTISGAGIKQVNDFAQRVLNSNTF